MLSEAWGPLRAVRRGLAVGVAALSASALLFSGSAAAAITVGQSPPAVGSTFTCGPGVGLQISSSSGTPYVVPSPGGVITKWRSSASGTVALTIWTGSGTTWTPVAENERAIAGVPTEFGVQIPVSGGEHIGLRMPSTTPGCLYKTSDLGDSIGVAASAPIGVPTPIATAGEYRFNVAVTVEPDADHDGYGDETQDRCPTNPSTQSACPVVADVIAPETSIGKHPPTKTRKRKVKFAFSANESNATFECKLDQSRFTPCTSPFKKSVGIGKHRFAVRATDSAGNRDSSAAKYKWRVLGDPGQNS